jgi:hypothetical protein
MLLAEGFQIADCCLELALDLGDALLEILSQLVCVISTLGRLLGGVAWVCDSLFECLDGVLVLRDDLLAEVGPLRQLFLHLLVQLQVFLQCLYLARHRPVLKNQILRLLRLELELAGELLVLLYGQPCGALEFVLIEVEHVDFDLFDLLEHLLAHLLHALVLLNFQLRNLLVARLVLMRC